MMFDKDNSDSIDMEELKEAMKALGIFMNKAEVTDLMDRIDKDGSGQLDRKEFTALMCELLAKRNQYEEMKKVFRYYDNDDDGELTKENLI